MKDFKGVIVSDFYAAYDSLPCQQQKCLIHLIRDINGDLIKAPFDDELKEVAQSFTVLLREIVATIDAFGLKKRRLARHKPTIKKFFRGLGKRNFSSEYAAKYQKRFLKSKDKLFTFINHDGVPWNSNAAEHAIKHLAELRSGKGLASHTKSHIDEYMRLISVYQTCEYRDVSFLRFLLSGKRTL